MLKTNTVDTIALLSICISFWNALYKDKDKKVSKMTAIATCALYLNNEEHPGFGVKFIPDEMKLPIARQILKNFNNENWLLSVNITKLPEWKRIENLSTLHANYNVPKIDPDNFIQIYEVSLSIHALKKGIMAASNPRRAEVYSMKADELRDYEHY